VPFPRVDQEIRAGLLTKVVIEQDDIDGLLTNDLESLWNRGAVSGDFEVRFTIEQPAQTVTKERVIVEQKYADFRFARLCHCAFLF
jgi:hypothetical protein